MDKREQAATDKNLLSKRFKDSDNCVTLHGDMFTWAGAPASIILISGMILATFRFLKEPLFMFFQIIEADILKYKSPKNYNYVVSIWKVIFMT